MYHIPSVIEKTARGEKVYDVFSRLLKDRIVMLGSEINDDVANAVVAQLLFLEAEDKDKPIYMYINSPGGVVTSGMAIYDVMNFINPPVVTICMGQAASMGAFLLSCGAPGKRYALPQARIMIHQPLGGAQGQATDIAITAKEILRIKETLTTIMAERSNHPLEKVSNDMERDYFMTAAEAADYGIIDRVITTKEDAAKA